MFPNLENADFVPVEEKFLVLARLMPEETQAERPQIFGAGIRQTHAEKGFKLADAERCVASTLDGNLNLTIQNS